MTQKNYYADALENNMPILMEGPQKLLQNKKKWAILNNAYNKNLAVIMRTMHQTVAQSGFQLLGDKWSV